ncbi:MAG: hypothetical protein NVS3B10_22890 [Polyangiales bacterium]
MTVRLTWPSRDDEALSIAPGGSRRGLVAAGVRLPIFGATRGPGCISRWLLVGPLAYVCSDKIRFSADAPGVAASIQPPADGGLPYRYYFVGADGADGFGKLADVDDETPLEQLDKGWAVAGVAEVSFRGRTFVQTRRGRFVARNQLGAIAANGFHGEALDVAPGAELGVGWVMPDKATLYTAEKTSSKSLGTRTRLQRVRVVESKKVGKDAWHRVDSDGVEGWMRGVDLRVPTPATLPIGLHEGERWIDVDVTTQSLVAYEGARPVFATVVSTGRPGPSTATPKGTFKIWVKLRTSTMSNADDAPGDSTEEGATYSIEDVPWVQYFSKGVALHGAFWHRRFGFAHSHGCVNLAPLDALRLFEWTLPRMPRGWDATFPTAAEPSTVVKVR